MFETTPPTDASYQSFTLARFSFALRRVRENRRSPGTPRWKLANKAVAVLYKDCLACGMKEQADQAIKEGELSPERGDAR